MKSIEVVRNDNLEISKIKVNNRFRTDKGNVEDLASSIEELGLIHPIVVTNDMHLIAGERRLLAHKHLGRTTIRADIIVVNTKVKKLQLELDENVMRLEMSWPDRARLEAAVFNMKKESDPSWSLRKQEELRGVSKSHVGMRIQLAEAMELIPELGEMETQDEAWKAYKQLEETATVEHMRQQVPDTISKAPQWAKDHYRVGDTLEEIWKVDECSVDFAEVDPPYGIDLVRRKSRNEDKGNTETYEEVDEKVFPQFMQIVAEGTYRALKPNTFAVFWFGMQWYTEVYKCLTSTGFAVNPLMPIWYKGIVGQTAQPDVALGSVYEPFFLARKGQPRMMKQGRANVFHHPSVPSSKKIHSTEKPIDLLADILGTILMPGSTVLVPFLGSGVTLRAAYRLGHTGFGWDLSTKHKNNFLKKVAEEFANV